MTKLRLRDDEEGRVGAEFLVEAVAVGNAGSFGSPLCTWLRTTVFLGAGS
jgi:hypothetical protein